MLIVLSVSVVLASVGLPPSDPQNNPPGPSVFGEQAEKLERAAQAAKHCEENYKAALDYCARQGYHHAGFVDRSSRCAQDALKAYHECLKGAHYFLNPPQLTLPQGGSPGQGN